MPAETTLITGNPPPRRLAQYELLRKVGSGAMGVVYEARDVDLDRKVAIKLLHPDSESMDSGEQLERFMREARAAARMVHPNVAVIYQVGDHAGTVFVAMEWLDGGDLSNTVKRHGPLPWRDAVRAAIDAAAALGAAHASGLVHRDVKPSNLIRVAATGAVKLVDFGLVRFAGMMSDMTRAGDLIGSPAYLSPEQCRGEEATAAADLYGLGCTLYFLLTGRTPFPAQHLAAVLHRHLNDPVPDPGAVVPELPGALWLILQRAMAKATGDRYASAAELQRDLEALIAPDVDIEASPPGPEPARPAATARGYVPPEPSSFVGRAAEAAALAHALASSRLVTLTGPGGTGKTRLALYLAHTHAAQHAVWFAELAPLARGEEIAPALAALLALRESAGETAADVLVKALRETPALLVLDNCEHVLASAAQLAARLLAEAPPLRILATSRERLGVAGETVLPVPPLGLGDPAADWRQLQESEAVRLFAARGASARPAFTVDERNAVAVATICRQLDGMPLAIELAAARLKVLSLAQIAGRLNEMLALLAGGAKDLEPRQRTLRALIDWSHDLLDGDERLVFARASVFAGGFDIEAAEAVLGSEGIVVLDLLGELVDKSLLVAGDHGEQLRYRMLETIRACAAEKLEASGEAVALRQRHAAHYAAVADAVKGRLDGAERGAALAIFAAERDNMHAALDTTIEARWFDLGARLVAAVARYRYFQGQLVDGLDRVQRFVAAGPDEDAKLIPVLHDGGNLALNLGRHELALQWFERGLTLARAAGDEPSQAVMLNILGIYARTVGRLDDAVRWFGEALATHRRVGARLKEARTLNNLAIVHDERGDGDRAREHYEAALAIQLELGNEWDAAVVRNNLGELALNANRPADAQAMYERAVDAFERLGDPWHAAHSRGGLGICSFAARDYPRARRHLEDARRVLQQHGDKKQEATMLNWLARVALAGGDPQAAAEQARASLAMRFGLGYPADLAESIETLALLEARADPQRSAQLMGCGQALRERTGRACSPFEAQLLDRLREHLRSVLGHERLEASLAAGRAAEPAALV